MQAPDKEIDKTLQSTARMSGLVALVALPAIIFTSRKFSFAASRNTAESGRCGWISLERGERMVGVVVVESRAPRDFGRICWESVSRFSSFPLLSWFRCFGRWCSNVGFDRSASKSMGMGGVEMKHKTNHLSFSHHTAPRDLRTPRDSCRPPGATYRGGLHRITAPKDSCSCCRRRCCCW
jgi:hypothetical protein